MISLLRSLLAAVEGRPYTLPADVDDQQVLTVARRHRLTPLLSLRAAPATMPSLAEAFRRDRLITTARNAVLAQVALECASAFSGAGIETVLLKGLAYNATLYDAPGLRPTSDVDVLVPGDARRAAFGVLDKLGFEPRAAAPGFDDADYHEVAWTRQTVEVDLHLALAPLARCRIDYDDVWGSIRRVDSGEVRGATLHPRHAAVFHALHMAMDHFDVPALYLLDFSRLLPGPDEREQAAALARAWRCWRPFATTVALTAAFLPDWAGAQGAPVVAAFSRRVVDHYGAAARVPRREQLIRKLAHFDTPGDAVGYLAVQARRNVRELWERRVRRRPARQRLALGR